MRILLVCFVLSFLISPATALAACGSIGVSKSLLLPVGTNDWTSERKLNGGSYALVVGASGYDGVNWEPLPDIAFEQQAVTKELVRQGFQVEELCDPRKIGTAKALAEIRQFIERYGVGDNRLVIYLAGHGWAEQDNRRGYFATVNSPKAGDIARPFGFSSIDMLDAADRFRGRHLLIIVNSCFSATLFTKQGGAAYPPVSLVDFEALQQPVRRFITAGEPGSETPSPSPFAAAFVLGIAGHADLNSDGLVRGSELVVWLRDIVTRSTRPTVPISGNIPNPRREGTKDTIDKGDISSGDIVFRYDPMRKSEVVKDLFYENSANYLVATRHLPEAWQQRKQPTVDSSLPADYRVFFFEKDSDHDTVKKALDARQVPHFSKPSVLPASGRINGIACHPGAPAEAVRAVARALIEGGVDIRIIDQAKMHLNERRNIIQVLQFARVDAAYRPDLRPLRVADLDAITGCPNEFVRKR